MDPTKPRPAKLTKSAISAARPPALNAIASKLTAKEANRTASVCLPCVLTSEAPRIGEEQPQDDHRTDQTDQPNVLHGQIISAPGNYPTASLFGALSGLPRNQQGGP